MADKQEASRSGVDVFASSHLHSLDTHTDTLLSSQIAALTLEDPQQARRDDEAFAVMEESFLREFSSKQ